MRDGTIAVRSGLQAGTPSSNFHFWGRFPNSSVGINGTDVGGVFTTVMARLIPDQPDQPFNLTNAQYLLAIGIDVRSYLNQQPPSTPGTGRHKWVKPYWRAFNFINWLQPQIREDVPSLGSAYVHRDNDYALKLTNLITAG
jgi:hypothetical protein